MIKVRIVSLFPWLLLLLAASAQAATEVAQVVLVRGSATVVRSGDASSEAIARGSHIYLNDRIKTAESGRVKLLLKDDSVLKVSPSSELVVNQLVLGPGEESQTTMKLLKGKLRSLVGKKLGANSRFEVHTGVAVAGVRGTDFEVLAAQQTWVRCYEGIVAVGNIDEDIPEVVLLTANMYTRVSPDMPPTQPEFIAPSESLEKKAGMDEPQDGEEKDKDSGLDDLETDQIDDDSNADFSDIDDSIGDLLITQELLEEQLLGDVIDGQIETIVEQPAIGSSVPIDITIPAP